MFCVYEKVKNTKAQHRIANRAFDGSSPLFLKNPNFRLSFFRHVSLKFIAIAIASASLRASTTPRNAFPTKKSTAPSLLNFHLAGVKKAKLWMQNSNFLAGLKKFKSLHKVKTYANQITELKHSFFMY